MASRAKIGVKSNKSATKSIDKSYSKAGSVLSAGKNSHTSGSSKQSIIISKTGVSGKGSFNRFGAEVKTNNNVEGLCKNNTNSNKIGSADIRAGSFISLSIRGGNSGKLAKHNGMFGSTKNATASEIKSITLDSSVKNKDLYSKGNVIQKNSSGYSSISNHGIIKDMKNGFDSINNCKPKNIKDTRQKSDDSNSLHTTQSLRENSKSLGIGSKIEIISKFKKDCREEIKAEKACVEKSICNNLFDETKKHQLNDYDKSDSTSNKNNLSDIKKQIATTPSDGVKGHLEFRNQPNRLSENNTTVVSILNTSNSNSKRTESLQTQNKVMPIIKQTEHNQNTTITIDKKQNEIENQKLKSHNSTAFHKISNTESIVSTNKKNVLDNISSTKNTILTNTKNEKKEFTEENLGIAKTDLLFNQTSKFKDKVCQPPEVANILNEKKLNQTESINIKLQVDNKVVNANKTQEIKGENSKVSRTLRKSPVAGIINSFYDVHKNKSMWKYDKKYIDSGSSSDTFRMSGAVSSFSEGKKTTTFSSNISSGDYPSFYATPKKRSSLKFGFIWIPRRRRKYKNTTYNPYDDDYRRTPSMYPIMSGDSSDNQPFKRRDEETELIVAEKSKANTTAAAIRSSHQEGNEEKQEFLKYDREPYIKDVFGDTKETDLDNNADKDDDFLNNDKIKGSQKRDNDQEASGDTKERDLDKNMDKDDNYSDFMKTKEPKKKENDQVADNVDSVYLRRPPAHKVRSNPSTVEEEEDCAMKCLYYTLQCCDCVLM